MDCVITNGKAFIKLNEKGQPVSCVEKQAQTFPKEKAENIFKSLPNNLKKFHFKIKNIYGNEEVQISEMQHRAIIDDKSKTIIDELDDFYEDYKDISREDKDNPHTYKCRTIIEDLEDVPGTLKEISAIISQLDTYVENMEYIQRDLDLKILDIRHYIRNNKTKLSTVHMAKLGYVLQDLERQRAECKMNKNYCALFARDINRFKQDKFVDIINQMEESEYRYRRLDEDTINNMIGKR